MKYKNFVTTGEARDQEWIVNNQLLLESYIHDDMRSKGFVPVLDQETDVRWWYIKDRGIFGFRISIKGLKVGKKNSKKYIGVQNNMLIDDVLNPHLIEFAMA